MKNFLHLFSLSLLLLLTLVGNTAVAQGNQPPANPISWQVSYTPDCGLEAGSTVTVRFTATIPGAWHVYSAREVENMAYRPTSIKLKKGSKEVATLTGGLQESGNLVEEYDDILEGDILYYKKTVTFTQRVKLKKPTDRLEFVLIYQCCEFEKYNTCIYPEAELTANLAAAQKACPEGDDPQSNAGDNPEDGANEEDPDNADQADDTTPADEQLAEGEAANEGASDEEGDAPLLADGEDGAGGKGKKADLLLLFFGAIGGGLIALLTPCVFPMIPMTVSFFTKRKDKSNGKRDAIIYVLSIIFIFTVVGVLLTVIFGPTVLYNISINPWVNMFLFALLVFFSLSLFGLFDITLPSSWTTKLDQMSERGGPIGIFFMASALVLASFSCTGPILGGALGLAAKGGIFGPAVLMFGFALGFGIPFGVFAFFPSALKGSPKPGGWMNAVKVSLGFIELALSLKFLSMADLRWKTHFLPRDIFLAVWIVIAILFGLYLIGKIRLPHDSKLEKIPVLRLILAMFVFSFALYLIPGMFGAPLAQLSGYLPPQARNSWSFAGGPGDGGTGGAAEVTNPDNPVCTVKDKKYAELEEATPAGFCAFYDLEEARKYAEKWNKPLFIDFTGHTCANCRQMERNVWPHSKVRELLNENYVMVSLFVDDDTPLEQPYETEDGDEVTTIGRHYQLLQLEKFNTVTQPYYVVADPQMETLNEGVGYTPDVQEYIEWLETGLKRFNKRAGRGGEEMAAAE